MNRELYPGERIIGKAGRMRRGDDKMPSIFFWFGGSPASRPKSSQDKMIRFFL